MRLAKDQPGSAAFITEIEEVCRRHDRSIAHEDSHGAFIVEPFDQSNVDWLRNAVDGVDTDPITRVAVSS